MIRNPLKNRVDATLVVYVGTHSLESFVVEHLAEGAQRDGTMKVTITHELGLDL